MNPLPASGAERRQPASLLQRTPVRVATAALVALALFFIGRHFCHCSTDFIVYHLAAKSFLAGRTDLYSETFALGPPMQYVYPPLFLLMVLPLGWLPFADAFGIRFATLALATGLLLRLAYREWRPLRAGNYWLIVLTIAAVPVLYALRTGNAHLLVVLLTLAGIVAWSRKRIWAASLLLALAGAIKVFPLLLFPFFVVRREWKLALRLVLFSCVFWALPMVYFGPRQTVALYQSWYDTVARDVQGFERLHQLDYSLAGTTRRWLSHVDYPQFRDKDYPQANWLDLPPRAVRAMARVLQGLVLGFSLLLVGLWREPRAEEPVGGVSWNHLAIATTASLFVTSQLLVGPYTIFLYLSAWLILALTLPVVVQHCAPRLNHWLLAIGVANFLILAIPGRSNRRALEAYGAFSVLGIGLWLISMIAGWKVLQATRFRKD